jgi:hypothetical protein
MGVVSTSDSLDHTQRDLDVMRSEGAAVKEMEAAACAWVAQQSQIPFVAVKVSRHPKQLSLFSPLLSSLSTPRFIMSWSVNHINSCGRGAWYMHVGCGSWV